ncbi:Cu(I)-responsive transcriptional regulator [Streptomyces anthocyanicus]|uniref:heavy metal-responsive transcriptional regulator n=1 Tax=Streptomyces anthocyanicus TaxID=68174 RepID=UPI0019839183|nr:heavy metal-responsive transcriptional regulator [Streptomyces anthocyanicus]GGL35384.1 Cu(I)-responsive transcriptional regulator [Streptomyces anthocyanicus]
MTIADQYLYTVSQAAEQAGVTRKAIRTWEDKGLLPPAERTEAGYRLFTADDIAVLRFIRQAKTLGLTLSEVGDILALQREGAQPCGRVTQLLDAHIDQIDRTMADLQQLRKALVGAHRTADQARRAGGDAVVCQIIETSPAQ